MNRLSLLVELASPFIAPDVPTMAALQSFIAADGLEVDTSPMWRLALLDGSPNALLSCLPTYLGRPMPVNIFARFVEPEDLKACSADAFAQVAGRIRDARWQLLVPDHASESANAEGESDRWEDRRWGRQEDDAFDWRRLDERAAEVTLGRAAGDPYAAYLEEEVFSAKPRRRRTTSASLRQEVLSAALRERGYEGLAKHPASQRWILGYLRGFFADAVGRVLDELETIGFLLAETRYPEILAAALAEEGVRPRWFAGRFGQRTYDAVWSAETRARDEAVAEYVAYRGPVGLPRRAAWIHEAKERAKAAKAEQEYRTARHLALMAEQRKAKEERLAREEAAKADTRAAVVERHRLAFEALASDPEAAPVPPIHGLTSNERAALHGFAQSLGLETWSDGPRWYRVLHVARRD